MAGIDDLDPDRGGVQVALALPESLAGVPGAALFRDQLVDPPVLPEEIVRRHFGGWIRQELERRLGRRHARVMQDETVRRSVPTLAEIRRRNEAAGQWAVGGETGTSFFRRLFARMAGTSPAIARVAWLQATCAGLSSVVRHADPVAVVVVTPARAASDRSRRRGGADQRARSRPDRRPRKRAARRAAGYRRADQAPAPAPSAPPTSAFCCCGVWQAETDTATASASERAKIFFMETISRPSFFGCKGRPRIAAGAAQAGQPARFGRHNPTNREKLQRTTSGLCPDARFPGSAMLPRCNARSLRGP